MYSYSMISLRKTLIKTLSLGKLQTLTETTENFYCCVFHTDHQGLHGAAGGLSYGEEEKRKVTAVDSL